MKERKKPYTGQLYRHFKNNLYQIITIAIHEATREEMVVYQALYGDYGIYVRTLENFMEPVDSIKYPNAQQTYRFELVEKDTQKESSIQKDVAKQQEIKLDTQSPQAQEEPVADPKLLAFCEAKTYAQKYEMLKSFRGKVSDRLINDLAVVLDVVIPEGELDDRYEALIKCLQTFCKFEVNRLR